ncbi:MAG: Calx-beta domain-containing protein [Kofleriaceae bacterium]|nr:Calx-beta domain-containing protein [Kofleriaceae bacterium]
MQMRVPVGVLVALSLAACGDNRIHAPGEATVVVTPTSGLMTTEAGGTATFTIVLGGQPSGDVTIPLSSSQTTEGTVDQASLVFTRNNWNAPQTVTITGVDDLVADGPHPFTIVTGATTSDDARFADLAVDDVAAINVDNDSPGAIVTPTTGLVTTENGGQAIFTVVLSSQPTADVQIALSSTDTTEGTVGPASLTFTSVNWNAPQTVTVTGVDDDLADGAQTYMIVTAAATSTDAGYQALELDDVEVSNTDNDTAGVTVTPTDGLVTTEGGLTDSFTIVLNAEPTDTVTIPVTSSDTSEGTVAVAQVVFTTANWNAPQTVILTGVDDNIADGNQVYSIVTGSATSNDSGYNGFNAADVEVTNTDNDSPGITVAAEPNLQTTEGGGQATFTVVLNSQPTADVTIALTSSNTNEGTVSPTSLTFTATDWNAPQTVTVTGVNDDVADGNQVYTIVTAGATSADAGYQGRNANDVTLTNVDNDTAGITVTAAPDLKTTEGGGTASFSIVLNTQPTSSVTIALASSDTSEGTVTVPSVTFTTLNWNAPQTVTVQGINDALADGNQVYTILTGPVTGSDASYTSIDPQNVTVTNVDNDTAGFTVTPTGVTTTEAGGTGTFSVVLNSEPTDNVTVTLVSSDPGEGTVSPTTLLFTPQNWNAPVTVTVTGVDDLIADGAQPYTIQIDSTSADAAYEAADPADVTVTNTDNDQAGITVTAGPALQTTEGGGQTTFSIVLNSEPTADVTIPLTSSDVGEGTVSPASLTFTTLNWDAPQFVTVTGVEDAIADGSQVYAIITGAAQSADGSYQNRNAADVPVTNIDNDSAGYTVSPAIGSVTESGGSATFTIVLRSQPTSSVSIALAVSNANEAAVSPASLTFTSTNWNAPQQVTVTGTDDFVADGNQPFTVITGPVTTADAQFAAIDPADVSLVNIDNDSAGILVTPLALTTTEASGAGHQATFTIVLLSQPTADVQIPLTSNDTGEGLVSPASLTFTAVNWAAPQTVTVTGVDDAVADGSQTYRILTGPTTSGDAGYNNLNPSDVDVANVDDDSAGITVTPVAGLETTEGGGEATFTVVLNSQPTANVTIALTSSDTGEGTITPAMITFTPVNWSAAQTITLHGEDDSLADGNQTYTIVTQPADSSDVNYENRNAADVAVTNRDNDSAGVVVSSGTVTTTEGGGEGSFFIRLNSQPTQNVTIPLATSDATEGTLAVNSVTFTPLNWSAPVEVVVTGVEDSVADGDQSYEIVVGLSVSTDPSYNNIDGTDVLATNQDNDSKGITVTVLDAQTTEAGGEATFTIVLTSQPTADVVVNLSTVSDEGTIAPDALTFTPGNWNAPQTVTVTGVDDFVADGTQTYIIITEPAISSDVAYDGLDAADVQLHNLDNDSPSIVVSPTSGLTTTEVGGMAQFTIVLGSQPTADVIVPLSSSDTGEGTIVVGSVTFTMSNWSTPQTVTVTGVDDPMLDGNQPYNIVTGAATSADPGYAGIDPANVVVTNIDNDSAGITVTPSSGLYVSELGDTETFTIVLNAAPTANVTIALASSDATEGTVSPVSVTFTTANWNVPVTVTVTGVNDNQQDGNPTWSVVTAPATSSDVTYNGMNASNVEVITIDNETPQVYLKSHPPLITTEAGGTATFEIRLTQQPDATLGGDGFVTCDFSSSDTTEGTVSPTSVTFNETNWNTPRTITITGVNDPQDDGDQLYGIVTAACWSNDIGYIFENPRDLQVLNLDND